MYSTQGDTISFWDDIILGRIFSMKYPNLYSFAKEAMISLKRVRESENIVDLFRIPMTSQAHNELLLLADDLLELNSYDHEENDEWTFIWGHTVYSAQKFYQRHFISIRPLVIVLWIWKSKCIPRINFFTWLLLNDRLNTRNILRRRKKFLEDYSCVMCQNNIEETLDHLFFDCHCASARWFILGIIWNEEV